MQRNAWRITEEHGFHELDRSVGDKLMLMVSELAEALEYYRDGHPANQAWYDDLGKPHGVPFELADVVIRIGDFCEENGIDLDAAIAEKNRFNETRPHLHGGKKL